MSWSLEQAEERMKANEVLYQKLRSSGKGPVGSSDGGLGDQRETVVIGAVAGRRRDVTIGGGEVTVQGWAKAVLADGEVEFIPGAERDFAFIRIDELRHIAPALVSEARAAIAADRQRKRRELEKRQAGTGTGETTFEQLRQRFDYRLQDDDSTG